MQLRILLMIIEVMFLQQTSQDKRYSKRICGSTNARKCSTLAQPEQYMLLAYWCWGGGGGGGEVRGGGGRLGGGGGLGVGRATLSICCLCFCPLCISLCMVV